MIIRRCSTVSLLLVSQLACAGPTVRPVVPAPTTQPRVGLLVMAHGGGSGWNADVARAIEPLRARLPTALAFGMADPTTLAAGLDSLAARGVSRVALVRVFVSGESFLQRTAQLLRLGVGPTPDSTKPRIEHDLQVATHLDGLADWDGIAALVVQRATDMSRVRVSCFSPMVRGPMTETIDYVERWRKRPRLYGVPVSVGCSWPPYVRNGPPLDSRRKQMCAGLSPSDQHQVTG